MKRAEIISRQFFGRLKRMPRKRKKVAKRAIKRFINAEIDNGTWDLLDYLGSPFLGGTAKEHNSYGGVPLKN